MSEKLQELTDRLYKDGVERAREEAAAILADAETRKDEIVRNAQRDAEALLAKARKDAEALKSRMENELSLAGRQAEDSLKQRLADLLTDAVLDDGTTGALGEADFLKTLILIVTEAWASDGRMPEISLVLGEAKQAALEAELKSSLANRISEGLEIQFTGRMKAGFQIIARDGTYRISFTDEDFSAFFRSFVRDATRSALFGN